MPNKALSNPAYKPAMPSRSKIRLAADRVPVCAFFFSTCARVERVINGYLGDVQNGMLSSRVTRFDTHVNAMDNSPPPAPAKAWATLSLCCSAAVCCAALSYKCFFQRVSIWQVSGLLYLFRHICLVL